MKLKYSIILQVLIFISQSAFSQTYAFKVLVNKGKNEVKTGNTWQPIKVGARLQLNDEIRLADNAYVGLVHESGNPLEVKKSGPHKISVLESQVKTEGVSVLTKYTDFILSSNSESKNNLKATGAVTRGPDNIEVYLPTAPSYTVVYGEEVIVSWNNEKLQGPFKVTFSNPFGDVLKEVESSSNSVSINLADRDFQYEDNILIKIVSRADNKVSPDQLMVKRLSRADKERIKKQLDEIAATTSEETALNSLVRAGFFESQNLLIDASTAYQKAIEIAPEVPEFKEYYQAFLFRTGMKTVK